MYLLILSYLPYLRLALDCTTALRWRRSNLSENNNSSHTNMHIPKGIEETIKNATKECLIFAGEWLCRWWILWYIIFMLYLKDELRPKKSLLLFVQPATVVAKVNNNWSTIKWNDTNRTKIVEREKKQLNDFNTANKSFLFSMECFFLLLFHSLAFINDDDDNDDE